MDEKSLDFVNQLIEKTEQGKISWSTGFEDGQFKTLLPGGKLAFVVQVKGDVRKFRMLDDRQEVILEETLLGPGRFVSGVPNGAPGSPTFRLADENGLDRTPSEGELKLFEAIGTLQGLAKKRALQVSEKLAEAEKLLAAI